MRGAEGNAPRGAWGSTRSRGASGQLRGTASKGEHGRHRGGVRQGEGEQSPARVPAPRDAGVRRDRAPPPFYGSAAAAQHTAAGSGTLRGLLFASEAPKRLPQSPWLHRLPPGCVCPSPSSGVEGQLRWAAGHGGLCLLSPGAGGVRAAGTPVWWHGPDRG